MEYLTALVGPFFLLLVEKFLPYPYVIEEIFKFFLAKKANSIKTAITLGFLFSLSESVFYIINPSFQLSPMAYIVRFIMVTLMHVSTILVMQYFIKKKSLWLIGLILAILIHYLFNTFSISTQASF